MKFYAAARSAYGESEATLANSSIKELSIALSEKNPQLKKLLPTCTFLVNSLACSDMEQQLNDGDNVDVLPQFSGG